MSIYNNNFSSMFEGSMVGAGSDVFAVMTYVISHMHRGLNQEEFVWLNSKVLAATIGSSEDSIIKAIAYLCSPAPNTVVPQKQDGPDRGVYLLGG